MKKCIILLILFLKGYAQIPDKIDSTAVYVETNIGKVDNRDNFCLNNIKLAKNDFDKNNITYYDFRGFGSRIRNREIFKEEIEKLNIKYELVLISCILLEVDGFVPKEYCYEDCMNKLLLKKYGENYFEKLDNYADSLFVLQNLNRVFNFIECDAGIIRYKKSIGKEYNSQFEDIKNELNRIIKYPENFNYRNEEKYSWTTCSFIIHKNGEISNIELETKFQNTNNEKFKKYFEEKIKQFVINSEWIPATIYGIKVDSVWYVNFRYK